MDDLAFTCPRCFFTAPLDPDMRFCPRCGLAEAVQAMRDTAPLDITSGGRVYRVGQRMAIGSLCSIYRCHFREASRDVEAVLKIARDPRSNPLLQNEAEILRRLHALDHASKFTPFLPTIVASFVHDGRAASVLRMHP